VVCTTAWALSQVREILGDALGPGGVPALPEERDPRFAGLTGGAESINDPLVRLINQI
jgi:hypothetical protein